MNELSTYQVYTTSPKGAFRLRYEGTDEDKALEEYNKLIDANKPRLLNRDKKEVMQWGI